MKSKIVTFILVTFFMALTVVVCYLFSSCASVTERCENVCSSVNQSLKYVSTVPLISFKGDSIVYVCHCEKDDFDL